MAPSGSNISPVSQTVRPPVGLFGSSWVRCAGRACGGRGFKLEILALINYPAVWDHREPVHVTPVTSRGFWGAGRSPQNIPPRAVAARDRHLEDRQTPGGQRWAARGTLLSVFRRHAGASCAVRGAAVRALPGGEDGSREGRAGRAGLPLLQLQQTGEWLWSLQVHNRYSGVNKYFI